jgi:hypothetical protein
VTSQFDKVGCRAEGAHQELPWIQQAHDDRLGFLKLTRRVAEASVKWGGVPRSQSEAKACWPVRLRRRGGSYGFGDGACPRRQVPVPDTVTESKPIM